jgi:DNA-binding response OmpR family regulator
MLVGMTSTADATTLPAGPSTLPTMEGVNRAPRVLVVEDDLDIAGVLRRSLDKEDYEVRLAGDGEAALEQSAVFQPDAVILDLGLPKLDGVEVCRRLRISQPGAVLVMLTARSDEMDVVVGLEAGADDYLTKPFRFGELLARVRAHLRRSAVVPPAQAVLAVGSLLVDVGARRVTVGGDEVSLRTKEFELLARLASDAGSAVSRETLMADVWDAHWYGSTKTLDVHVAALRRKLAAAGDAEPPAITTLRGHGYRMETAGVPD